VAARVVVVLAVFLVVLVRRLGRNLAFWCGCRSSRTFGDYARLHRLCRLRRKHALLLNMLLLYLRLNALLLLHSLLLLHRLRWLRMRHRLGHRRPTLSRVDAS